MPGEQSRKLTAIVAADVAGYSRLTAADEEGTLAALRAHRSELIDPMIAEHRGRIANTAGDSILIEFPSIAEPGRGASFVLQLLAGGVDKAPTPDEDRHFGFAMDSREDVDRRAVMAADEGILLWEPFEGPFPIGYICAVNDPNGNTVEISCGHLLESEVR
jgi:class 3 adenylate cyclase